MLLYLSFVAFNLFALKTVSLFSGDDECSVDGCSTDLLQVNRSSGFFGMSDECRIGTSTAKMMSHWNVDWPRICLEV